MHWFWTIVFLSFVVFSNCSEAENDQKKKVPSAVVVGTVYCDTCFQQNFHKASHFIAGASVAVECKNTTPSFRQEVKTNKHGQFKVHLPFPISKHTKKIKGCYVKLISSNQPYCSIAATASSSTLHLKSRKHDTHIFSAGFFTFKPLKQPELCDQKPKKLINDAEKSSPVPNPNDITFPPPLQDPPSNPPALGRNLPPLPQLPELPPLPQLPRLPPLPGIPLLPPIPKKENPTKSPQLSENPINQRDTFIFPPNPFNPPGNLPPIPLLPPPGILPPNPLLPPPSLIPPILPSPPPSIIPPIFPSPPPSIIPPIFPSPSSPPFFHLPPLPGLFPSPPPPPPSFPIPLPPSFPIPLPPFPFQPTPGFPGVPPAKFSSPPKTSSP